MRLDPSRIPSGLSWGMRGFRIGKSVAGNWWVSLGLPFGFRYVWFLGRSKSAVKNYPPSPQVTMQDHTEVIIIPETSTDIVSNVNKRSYSKIKPKI